MNSEKLFYQFYKAISKAFKPGIDKHSYKRSNCDKVRIFSYSDRRNIIKSTNQLCNYLENTFILINSIKDIDCYHVDKFLESKAEYCSKNTIKNYRYCIKKLEKIVRQYLFLKVTYVNENMNNYKGHESLRTIDIEKKDLTLLLEEAGKSKSKAKYGIELACLFGLRVNEICNFKCKDIDLENMKIKVHEGKGKRTRYLHIDDMNKFGLCNRIKETFLTEERVCPMKEDSVNAVIRRIFLKNNITKYNDHKTGIHAIRKTYSKESYKKHMQDINDEKRAWNKTSRELGHGKNRGSLKNTYVKI